MRAKVCKRVISTVFLACVATQAGAFDVAKYRMVDLTHPYGEETLYWPSRPASHFELQQLAHGDTEGGYFYSSNRFCTPEHGGTHLDAPIHFARGKKAVDQLALEQLIAPAVRIDVREQAQKDRSYRLSVEDVLSFEKQHGKISAGTIVLLQTGWSRYWPNRKQYLGSESQEDASGLDFPSYGEEVARLLIEQRGVKVLGVDTASIDFGRSKDFMVHRIAGAADAAGLENLTHLEELPETGFNIVALPMNIRGGSGGPVRVVALVPSDSTRKSSTTPQPATTYQPVSRVSEVWGKLHLSETSARLDAFKGEMALESVGVMPATAGDDLGGAKVYRVKNGEDYFARNKGRNAFCEEPPRWLAIRNSSVISKDAIWLGILTIPDYSTYTPEKQGYCAGGSYVPATSQK